MELVKFLFTGGFSVSSRPVFRAFFSPNRRKPQQSRGGKRIRAIALAAGWGGVASLSHPWPTSTCLSAPRGARRCRRRVGRRVGGGRHSAQVAGGRQRRAASARKHLGGRVRLCRSSDPMRAALNPSAEGPPPPPTPPERPLKLLVLKVLMTSSKICQAAASGAAGAPV